MYFRVCYVYVIDLDICLDPSRQYKNTTTTCIESKWLPWSSIFCKHLNSPDIGISGNSHGHGGGLLVPALH